MVIKRGYLVLIIGVFIIIGAGAILFLLSNNQQEFRLVPKKRTVIESGGISGTEVGTGWSAKEDPIEAACEAVGWALKNKKQAPPDFAAIFATSGADLTSILAESRKIMGNKIRIFGVLEAGSGREALLVSQKPRGPFGKTC